MTLRLYRALIRLLPRRVRERDGEEMIRTLADQIAGASTPGAVQWRALIRFPLLLALEWRDVLFPARVPRHPSLSRGSRMEALTRMIRQGARGLARTPAFSLSVILLLGIGVGSVSAIFAVVDPVLLRALPYPDADRLIVVANGPHSIPAVQDMQAMHSVEAWAAASTDNARLTDHGIRSGSARRWSRGGSSRSSAPMRPWDACSSRPIPRPGIPRSSPTASGSGCSAPIQA